MVNPSIQTEACKRVDFLTGKMRKALRSKASRGSWPRDRTIGAALGDLCGGRFDNQCGRTIDGKIGAGYVGERTIAYNEMLDVWRRGEESAMRETVAAYLLGPAVMLLVCAAMWAISRRGRGDLEERLARWIDAHRGHGMRHKH